MRLTFWLARWFVRSTFHNRHIGITHCSCYIIYFHVCLSDIKPKRRRSKRIILCVSACFFFPSVLCIAKLFLFFIRCRLFDSIRSFSRNSKSAYGVPLNYLFRWHHFMFREKLFDWNSVASNIFCVFGWKFQRLDLSAKKRSEWEKWVIIRLRLAFDPTKRDSGPTLCVRLTNFQLNAHRISSLNLIRCMLIELIRWVETIDRKQYLNRN